MEEVDSYLWVVSGLTGRAGRGLPAADRGRRRRFAPAAALW